MAALSDVHPPNPRVASTGMRRPASAPSLRHLDVTQNLAPAGELTPTARVSTPKATPKKVRLCFPSCWWSFYFFAGCVPDSAVWKRAAVAPRHVPCPPAGPGVCGGLAATGCCCGMFPPASVSSRVATGARDVPNFATRDVGQTARFQFSTYPKCLVNAKKMGNICFKL